MRINSAISILTILAFANCNTVAGLNDMTFDDWDTNSTDISDSESHGNTDSDTDADIDSDTNPVVVDDCNGIDDFTFCNADTSATLNGDFEYDICVRDKCLSPGSCGNASCNTPGPHFRHAKQKSSQEYDVIQGLEEEWVVYDKTTGLFWQRCTIGLKGENCKITDATFNKTYGWRGALSICDKLEWGDHEDWYLPDEWELHSITNYKSYSPTIETTVFPDTRNDWYWTSSSQSKTPTHAYIVSFLGGNGSPQSKQYGAYVRCVRRGPSPVSQSRFKRVSPNVKQPVVTDKTTSLMWQGCTSGQNSDANSCDGNTLLLTWDEAIDHCQNELNDQNYAGYKDWYLPSIHELRGIGDTYVATGATIDEKFFPSTQEQQYWSSTPFVQKEAEAWTTNFQNNGIYAAPKNNSLLVRCVRKNI